jgi:hypothetical protein
MKVKYMPQLQNVVLTDRESTPVDHTFTPRDIVNGLGTVVETAGIPVGEKQLQVALNRTSSGRYKGVLKFKVPVVQTQTVNGIDTPTVVRTSFVDFNVTFDPTSTEQERADVIGMFASALAANKTLINDTLVKLQGVY